jgi:phage gpG-like protein
MDQFRKLDKNLAKFESAVEKIEDNRSAEGFIGIGLKLKDNSKSALDKISRQVDAIKQNIDDSHAYAMTQVGIKLKEALDDALAAESWNWLDGTRDIVDSGELMASGSVRYDKNSDQLVIEYDNDYAGIVHYGGYIKSGYNASVQIFYPARPWIQSVLQGGNGIQRFDFGAHYTEAFFRVFES